MPSPYLTDRVAAHIVPLLPAHSSILIGLSGGADSVVLLHLLHQLAPRYSWRLSALHVHHGISPNAGSWAEFCSRLCAIHQIPLHVEHVDIAPLREHGIEAAARKLRHAAFAGQACDFVALAHHADDQAETLLLQLLRGAGVRGASAMPVLSQSKRPVLSRVEGTVLSQPKRLLLADREGSPRVLRPLLYCTRQEILAYAEVNGLQWIEDESNADDSYPRNFLRHRLLPVLEEKFPSYRNTLMRSSQHFAEASALLDELAQQDASEFFPSPACGITNDLAGVVGQPSQMASSSIIGAGGVGGKFCLEVARLQSLSQPRAKNLLRYFLHICGAPMPQAVQLENMLQQLCNARKDAAVCFTYSEWEVRRFHGRVYVLHAMGEFDRNLIVSWRGEASLDWPALNASLVFIRSQGEGISVEKLNRAPVTLRLRHGGESLRPHQNAAMRTLKNLLQESRVPPWQRDRVPLLYCGEELVSIPGVAIAAEYQTVMEEPGIQLLAG